MKITKVETVPVDRYLFVRVHTDAGVTGLGESGAWGYLEASEQVVQKFARYLVGQDPSRIEHHWNYLYRAFYFRGAAIMGALSAIDIALWDIAGKELGVPVYRLLGGKTRDRARVYLDIGGVSVEAMVAKCLDAKARGFTAVGHVSPFPMETKESAYFRTHSDLIGSAVDVVRRYREAVGDEIDLCIEIHRRFTPAQAIALGRAIEPYRILFYEDPLRPDNIDAMGDVAEMIGVPIATGERLHTIYEFEMLLRRKAAQYLRPSVGLCGGFTGAKKIAALAEAHHVGVCPHMNSSPFTIACNVQLAACIPNYVIQEYPNNEGDPIKRDIMTGVPEHDGHGCLIVPEAPGVGVELAADAAERYPYRTREIATKLQFDGAVDDF